MREVKTYVTNEYLEYVEYILSVVSTYENGCEEKYVLIKNDINTLIEKISDDSLYLGVIGSFSSGKSTFINSVIHKNLLPTKAVQGTTVATSIIKKSDRNDLKIVYTDGTVSLLSVDRNALMSKYQIETTLSTTQENERNGFWHRLIAWIKRILGIVKINDNYVNTNILNAEDCIALFRKIISTEEFASDIKYVALYYQNENIPHNISMVDTPGTESLNKRHNDVTKNAIDNICDAIVVVIPYDEPVSEKLIDYINSNLDDRKSECIFVVTKIELLEEKDELPQLLRVIKRRLENGLSIDNALVIPMPTFVYLKHTDPDMTTTFLDDISDADRDELIRMYNDGLEIISDLLEINRDKYIKSKIVSVFERVAKKLNDNLVEIVDDYDEKERVLRDQLVMPVSKFEETLKEKLHSVFLSEKHRLMGELAVIQFDFYSFESDIEKTLSDCTDSQQLLNQLNYSCYDVMSDIQQSINKEINETIKNANTQLKRLESEFFSLYSKCGIKSSCRLLSNNSSDFFDESFISECEKNFSNEIDAVKNAIRKDTAGLFKKVKAFFSNPFSQHKEMSLTQVLNAVENLNQNVKEEAMSNIDAIDAFDKSTNKYDWYKNSLEKLWISEVSSVSKTTDEAVSNFILNDVNWLNMVLKTKLDMKPVTFEIASSEIKSNRKIVPYGKYKKFIPIGTGGIVVVGYCLFRIIGVAIGLSGGVLSYALLGIKDLAQIDEMRNEIVSRIRDILIMTREITQKDIEIIYNDLVTEFEHESKQIISLKYDFLERNTSHFDKRISALKNLIKLIEEEL